MMENIGIDLPSFKRLDINKNKENNKDIFQRKDDNGKISWRETSYHRLMVALLNYFSVSHLFCLCYSDSWNSYLIKRGNIRIVSHRCVVCKLTNYPIVDNESGDFAVTVRSLRSWYQHWWKGANSWHLHFFHRSGNQ